MENDIKAPAKSLANVLRRNEHAKELVQESAVELSSVNVAFKHELADKEPDPGIVNVLVKSEAVENKVQQASDALAAVNQALGAEVKERHALEDQLATVIEKGEAARHDAIHDPLTGLPNRMLLNDRLEHGVEQAKRHSRILAVMFMDLDNFKTINDSYGHDAGDSVLQAVAERLKENTRGEDTVSRLGGDEFVFLLAEIQDEKDITVITEKIINAIQVPCHIASRDLIINPSIGIAIFPKDGTTADSLLKAADKAMYEAKRNKSGYSFSS